MRYATVMIICDAHCDLLQKRVSQPDRVFDVSLASLKAGGVSLQTLALYKGRATDPVTIEQLAQDMLAEFERMKREEGFVQIVDPGDAVAGEVKFLLSIEGGELIDQDLAQIDAYYDLGVRMVGLIWNDPNRLATPNTGDPATPLTHYGRQVVKRLQDKGMAVDISHLNDGGVADILTRYDMPPLASHSGCRALKQHTRNLSDAQLKQLFAAGGFVGVPFYPLFLAEQESTLDSIVDHMEHMYELGGEGKVGFGSDFDGISSKVPGLETPAGIPALIAHIRSRGFTERDVASIAGQAFLDYFERIR